MQRSWRIYLIVIGVAACWLSLAFVVVPRLGDPVSFNQVANTASPDGAETGQAGSQVTPRNFRGNVYHIIFDSYQSEAYPYFLAQTPELNQLPLTYFPNFQCNSSLTYFSMAQLFAGDFYTPGMSPESWHTAAFQSQGMMGSLVNNGVRLHLYPYYPEYCYEGASAECKTIVNLKKELLGVGRERQTAIDLWFLKLIPSSLKRELNARYVPQDEDTSDGSLFSNWDYGFSISNAISPSKMPGDLDNPYFSVQQFMRLLDEESSRPATGQYVFTHLILPHGPLELDGECNYVGRETAQGQAAAQIRQGQYLRQAQCADKLMALLVKKLESLGRLDNSLIIFQADHGYYWHPADLGVLYQYKPLDISVPRVDHDSAGTSPTWPSEAIEVKSSALLLVKFPGQSAASRSKKLAQMIDIAPTILRYFDIDRGSMHGIPIQDMPESPARERLFASNFAPNGRDPTVFSKFGFVGGKWKFEEDVVIVADTDLLFTIGTTR